ncbi:Ribokinase-like protein, partial [Xylaria flabelliformis]
LGCDSVNLASHLKACRLVDVFSPNRSELRYLIEGKTESEVEFFPSAVEDQARMFIDKGIGPNRDGLAVIRSGEHGVLTMSNDSQPEWFPAYYGKGATEVVDATGAGNTFVGAFAVAFQETKDRKEASIRAALAASFALEQFGPPKLMASFGSSGELWNGTNVLSRLQDFKTRMY